MAPDPVAPAPVAALPSTFAQAEAEGPYRPLAWWESYEDPVLNRLVALALDGNLDLQEAVARVEQARARARIEDARLAPTLEATGSTGFRDGGGNQAAGNSRDPGGNPPDGATGGEDASLPSPSSDSYSAGLSFAYELDFWGRARNAAAAEEARFRASIGDLQTAVLSAIAETIRAYFDIVALDRRIDLTRATVDLLRERSELTEQRYLRGLSDSFELYAIREQLRTAQAAVPGLENERYAALARLGVLLGGYPGPVEDLLEEALPLRVVVKLDDIPPGLPAALLIQRPDVRAAFLRLEAERLDVGAARGALFPQLSLTGSAGLRSGDPGGLLELDNWFTNIVAGLTAPLLNGGRLEAQVDAAEAGLAAQAATYARTVVTAFQEAETALNTLDAARERYRLLRGELETAEASADLQLRRYTQGVGDYLGFLDARRAVVQTRADLVQAERAVAEARLTVHRALGGAWVEEDLSVEARALIAAATGEGGTEDARDIVIVEEAGDG